MLKLGIIAKNKIKNKKQIINYILFLDYFINLSNKSIYNYRIINLINKKLLN